MKFFGKICSCYFTVFEKIVFEKKSKIKHFKKMLSFAFVYTIIDTFFASYKMFKGYFSMKIIVSEL